VWKKNSVYVESSLKADACIQNVECRPNNKHRLSAESNSTSLYQVGKVHLCIRLENTSLYQVGKYISVSGWKIAEIEKNG